MMNFGTFYFDSDNTLSYSGRWTSLGFKKYKDAEIIRSSGEELFTKEFLENYMHDLHINFTSSEGRAESYNMFNRGKEKHRFFEKFISANPDTGGHFKTRSSASDEIIDGEDKEREELDTVEEEEGERSTMHLLGRRNLSSGFNNHELVCELKVFEFSHCLRSKIWNRDRIGKNETWSLVFLHLFWTSGLHRVHNNTEIRSY